MEAPGLTIEQQGKSGTVTLVSYDEIQLQWAEDELNEGKVAFVQNDTGYVLVSYQDGMNWKVGDTLTVQTSAGDKQVTVAGILATVSANNAAGSEGYMICSEQTFMELAGDTGYITIDVQFSKEGNDDTVSAIRELCCGQAFL